MLTNIMLAAMLVGAQPAPAPHAADPRVQKQWWGEPVEFGNGSQVWMRAMSQDGRRAIVCDRIGMVCVEFAPPRIVWYRDAKGVHVAPRSVAFSPDGKLLATAESDEGANLYDAATGAIIELFLVEGTSGEQPLQVGFTDGKLVVLTYRSFHTPEKDKPAPPAGTRLPHNTISYSLIVWDPVTKKEMRRTHEVLPCEESSMGLKLLGSENTLELSTTTYEKGRPTKRVARFVNPMTGKSTAEIALGKDDLRSYGLSPDGQTLLTMSAGSSPRLVDMTTGRLKFTLDGHKRPVTDAAMSDDGKLIATVSGGYPDRFSELFPDGRLPDGPAEIFIWEAATGLRIARYQFPSTGNGFGHVRFSPDGRYLIVMSGWAGGERTLALGRFPFAQPKPEDRVGIPVIPQPAPPKPAVPAALPPAANVPPPAGGGLVADALDKLAEELPKSNRPAAQQIDALYLAVLGRLPTGGEVKKIGETYRGRLTPDVLKKIIEQLAASPEFAAHVKTLERRLDLNKPGHWWGSELLPGTNPFVPWGYPGVLIGGPKKK